MKKEFTAVATVIILIGIIATGFFALLAGMWFTLEGGADVGENGAKLIAGVFLILIAGTLFASCLGALARMNGSARTEQVVADQRTARGESNST